MTYRNISTRTGVYGIFNIKSRKWYVGSAARGFSYRWGRHRSDLRRHRHDNRHLQSAFDLYGEIAFKFVILEDCPPETCVEREQWWIDGIKPQYNLEPTAASSLGCVHSEEDNQRKSLAATGRVFSEEHKAALREAWKHRTLTEKELHRVRTMNIGRKQSEAQKEKARQAMMGNQHSLGVHPSEDTRKKLALVWLGRKHSPATIAKMAEARKLYWVKKKGA